jgi:DNA-binding response OmpR family regulator
MPFRIAVFDASQNLLALYWAILRVRGYEVFTYEHDMTSLDAMVELQPHLIILGNLLGVDPQEFDILHGLRAHPDLQAVPVVLATTGADRLSKMSELADIDNLHILSKPFHYQALLDCITRAFSLSH